MRFPAIRASEGVAACLFLFFHLSYAQNSLDSPLPDPRTLMVRAMENEKKLEAQQERYQCRVQDEGAELDKNGRVKKETIEEKEQFYVNGQSVERTIKKNGRELTPEETRKEDERVMKETVKFSNKAKADKETEKQNQQMLDILEAMTLTGGRREQVNSRSVLFYDIVPNPKFQPKNMNQRFAAVLQGTMSLDEQTGEVIDVNVRSVKDLKIAGGMVASLHKGFWLHIHNTPQPDGIWLNDLSEGSGDARALMFIHPYFRFKETTSDCRLYDATANQVGQASLKK